MKLSDYAYQLPSELIAQAPITPRDHSNLMVVSRTDRKITHQHFYDLPKHLRPGDVMVFNDSRVFPARLYGSRRDSNGKVELLLLRRKAKRQWQALVRPGRRMREGTVFDLSGSGHTIECEITGVHSDGSRTVRLSSEEHLDEIGTTPLPPYIHEPLTDAERYQTVYSRVKGSVAAPTAGLHFTPELLRDIRSMGVRSAFVTLHVGWGTFRPIQVEDVTQHDMHTEQWELGKEAAELINSAKREGRRVLVVGTTAVRLLEHAAQRGQGEPVTPGSGWADIFIYPGYDFRITDTLLTNFHLPKSTLLMLVSAFADHELITEAYEEAIQEGYRFYSFGDAMLIV